jgi:hypothetical protein
VLLASKMKKKEDEGRMHTYSHVEAYQACGLLSLQTYDTALTNCALKLGS